LTGDRAEMAQDAAPGSVKTADADDDYLVVLAQAHHVDGPIAQHFEHRGRLVIIAL
jgi:hypothetical protein